MTAEMAPARTGPQRVADALAKLRSADADVWVATASPAAAAHLVPLSYAWDGACILLAAEADSATVRNIQSAGRARLGFGPTRDVLLVDATLERIVDVGSAEIEQTARVYADQAGWDPRRETGSYVFVLLRPLRVQAWREANELSGKLLMRDGEWLFEV